MSTATNCTFEEIAVGDSASLTRTIKREDIAQFALLFGEFNPTYVGLAGTLTIRNMLGGALVSAILGTRFPGPGTVYVGQSLQFLRQIAAGDALTTTVTVREKHAETGAVILDCVCVDSTESTVMTGVAEVIAPTEKRLLRPEELNALRAPRRERYEQLMARCQGLEPAATAVAYPCSEAALAAVVEAAGAGLIRPILVGPKAKITALARHLEVDLAKFELVDAPHSQAAAETAVALAKSGQAKLLMKGSLHTDELLAEIVRKGSGLRTERRISHCFIMDVPHYEKPLIITDAAINIYPALEDKIDIIRNAVDLAHAFGLKKPRVAVLSAVETVNPKIASTLDAAALSKMADRGQIADAIIDGPLALDNAMSEEAADIKGLSSPVAGRADILVVPDLEAGNIIYKYMSVVAGADGAGVVIGAKAPVILTSRADSIRTRLASSAVAMLYARARQAAALAEG
ncbi:MAG TPA: bifunctional enoyl-CoA hydratase/phosphate acetyltransferase [Acidocella sp.]|jgi:phosphate butyryltransferase|nr:bifunctional enoyl-CoA hydratase/phosphate acetyltransferase [Acidocella sp.]